MKIELTIPKPPPEFHMTFNRDEGWALCAALKQFADNHPRAEEVLTWHDWADKLDSLLRQR